MTTIQDLLEKNNCVKCQQKVTFPKKKFEEDLEYHPDCYVRKEGIYCYKCSRWEDSNWKEETENTWIEKFDNWEGLVKKYPCSSCNYKFTKEDLKENNWQIIYSNVYETREIYNIQHLDCYGYCACQLCKVAHKKKNTFAVFMREK